MHRREWIYGWLFLSPALLFLFTFTHYPAVTTVISSFFSTPKGRKPAKFIGLENYQVLIQDDVFWKVLLNNFWFAVGTIPISIGLALLMALWVNSRLKGRTLSRVAFFAPTVLPLIAVANIWMFFYTPGFGLIDQFRSGLFGLPAINLLGNPDTVLAAMIVVAIWKEAGFFMIFYLAALQSIPPVLKEAADVEGADHIFVMTEGGPDNASSLLLYYIYETAFKFWQTGYAATLTVVMLVLLSLLAIGQFFLFDRKIHYK